MSRHPLDRRAFAKASVAGAVSAAYLAASCPSARPAAESARVLPPDTGRPIILHADLSRCLPASALSRTFEKGRWQLIDYATAEFEGTMVSALPEDACGELQLPLGATGPHKIYLGINYTKTHYPEWSPYGQLDVKLTGDAGFRRVGAEAESVRDDGTSKLGSGSEVYNTIQEAYWKTADVSGESLIVRQPQYPYNRPEHANVTNLCYVRLASLDDEERRRWKDERPREETRRLAVIFCTGQFTGHTQGTYTFHPTSRAWLRDEFQPYAGGDIKILVFEALRGNFCVYRTRIGDVGTDDNRWQDRWVDPLADLTGLAHDHGMRIFASLRMIGPQYPMNRAPVARARHYWRHPEWSRRSRDGAPLNNWSLAFPEVCKYWLSLLLETLEYGIDGLQIHLNRAEPFAFYEEPVVRSFQQRFGEDPRRLPENDPRVLTHRAGYVTQFLREVRRLLDEKPGRALGVTITGRLNSQNAHFVENQCDVETWLREGLVNYIMATPYCNLAQLKRWRTIAGDRVHLWPDLMPRAQPAESYARLAKMYYEAGADGLCLWDGERRHHRISEWAAVQTLGHRDMLERIIKEGPSYYRRVSLKRLGGFDVQGSFHDG